MSNEKFEIEFIAIEPKIDLLEVKPLIHYKNSRRNKTVWDRSKYEEKKVVWSLNKYAGKKVYDGIDWQYQGSSKELNEELTALKFVDKLNAENLFDFQYQPEDNDYLHIRIEYVNEEIKKKSRPYIGAYISFIFKKGKWTINEGYDHIGNDYNDFKEGIINTLHNSSL
jgi:hypothetical protein